jgi:hypothetical protein
MGMDCEFVLLIPLKKLDEFCEAIENFDSHFKNCSYFDEHYEQFSLHGAREYVRELRERIQNCLNGQKVEKYPSARFNIGYSKNGQRGSIEFYSNFPSLEYWQRRFGCFPVLVSGDCSTRCITSLLKEYARPILYAFLEIFPVALGFYVVDGSSIFDESVLRQREAILENRLEFDRTLFIGPEMLRFFEEYYLDEIDFFFKKKIGPQKYLFVGWLLYSVYNRDYFFEESFPDGEVCINDRLAFHDEKQLQILEGKRLRLLGFPKEIPDYKDWDSAKDSSE